MITRTFLLKVKCAPWLIWSAETAPSCVLPWARGLDCFPLPPGPQVHPPVFTRFCLCLCKFLHETLFRYHSLTMLFPTGTLTHKSFPNAGCVWLFLLLHILAQSFVISLVLDILICILCYLSVAFISISWVTDKIEEFFLYSVDIW